MPVYDADDGDSKKDFYDTLKQTGVGMLLVGALVVAFSVSRADGEVNNEIVVPPADPPAELVR